MRRALAIFLMLTLVLHSVWGAAEPYCQHESGAAAHHLGHHVHDLSVDHHEADAQSGDSADSKVVAKALTLADHGHHSCSIWVVMPESLATPPVFMALSELQPKPVKVFRSAFAHRIERPNWSNSL